MSRQALAKQFAAGRSDPVTAATVRFAVALLAHRGIVGSGTQMQDPTAVLARSCAETLATVSVSTYPRTSL